MAETAGEGARGAGNGTTVLSRDNSGAGLRPRVVAEHAADTSPAAHSDAHAIISLRQRLRTDKSQACCRACPAVVRLLTDEGG